MFLRGPSPAARLFFLCVLSIALMVLDFRNGHLDSVRKALSLVVYPVRAMVDMPFAAKELIASGVRDRKILAAENDRLKAEQLLASVRLQRFEALEAENTRLRALMESTAKVADRVLVGEILSVDLDPYRHRVAIDKGLRHGAFKGQALLDAHGIVGQITRTGPLSSEAILITDPDHAVPVEVNRNGLRTIAVGTGNLGEIVLPFLPNNVDIAEGDLLVTSGLGGIFPRGYPLARITSVKRDPHQSFASVTAAPAAALNRNREILLVWSGSQPTPAELARSARRAAGNDLPAGGHPR